MRCGASPVSKLYANAKNIKNHKLVNFRHLREGGGMSTWRLSGAYVESQGRRLDGVRSQAVTVFA